MVEPRAWSFLTIAGDRQYGGNEGYSDDPMTLYRYDSDVANHRRVQQGDLVVVRSRTDVIGMGRIEGIAKGSGNKQRLRCPECRETNIKRRSTLQPAWRCKNNHTFDQPLVEQVVVDTFEARYGSTFKPAGTSLTLEDVQQAVVRPSDQMSIKELEPGVLERKFDTTSPLLDLLHNFAMRLTEPPPLPDGTNDDEEGTAIETRRKVLRQIALRRGQARFRRRLMERYGSRCQITGCSFPGLLEAAHLRPYATSGDSSASNGILLRSDLHTLLDLGLVGIEPTTLAVSLNPAVLPAGYSDLEGAKLQVNGTKGPSRSALEERWDFYLKKLALDPTAAI